MSWWDASTGSGGREHVAWFVWRSSLYGIFKMDIQGLGNYRCNRHTRTYTSTLFHRVNNAQHTDPYTYISL